MESGRGEPAYRLAVRGEQGSWRWTVWRGEALAMQGSAADVEGAVRIGDFAAATHAALARIGRRRF